MSYYSKEILSSLSDVAEIISKATDGQSIANGLMEIVEMFVQVEYLSIYLWDPNANRLKLFANKGFTEEEKAESERTSMERHPGWVFKKMEMLHVADMFADGVPKQAKDSKRSFIVRSRLWLPITTKERAMGSFGFASKKTNYFTEDHINVLQFLCRLAGNAYSNIIFAQAEKEYHKQILQSYQQVKEASNAQQNFLAKMSHEIRTPMNGIIGLSRLLSESELTAEQQKMIDTINNQSIVLLNLINDILDISKIQSDNFNLVEFSFNLEDTIQNSVNIYSNEAKSKGIFLKFDFDEAVDTILIGDSLRISQIINNLISNAIKFTSKGGVFVRIILLDSTNEYQHIRIDVEDTGIGIEKDKQEKIFEKFLQEDDSIDRNYGGSGLGLAIVKEIVDKMDGTITLRSEKFNGSNFIIKLKIKRKQINETATLISESLHNYSIEGLNILIVEDNEVNLYYACTILEGKGVTCTKAENGKIALEKCNADEFDLILMDLQMPEMDGIAATKYIREELRLSTPIIALTANTVQKDIDNCFKAGVNDYLSKPFLEKDLISKIALNVRALSTKSSENTLDKKENIKIETKEAPSYESGFMNSVLELVNNDKEKAMNMLKVFSKILTSDFGVLNKNFAEKDFESLRKMGHKLKSSFKLLKLEEEFEICSYIESFNEEEYDVAELSNQIDKLNMNIDNLVIKVNSLLEK